MAYLNITGAETADMSEVHASGGTVSVQSTIKRTGDYAYRANPTSAAGYVSLGKHGSNGSMTALGLSTGYFCFYVRWATFPSSQIRFFQVGNSATSMSGASECISGYVDSGGVFVISGNSTSATIATFSTGVWYRVEVKAVQNGTCEAKVDGGTAQTATGVNNAVDYIILGNTGIYSWDVYYDDIAISDSAYPGAGEVRILKPNGAGTDSGWNEGTGNTYAEVDEVPPDGDTSYIKESTVSDNMSFHMESAATAGVAGTIGTVKAIAISRDEGGAAAQHRMGFRQGASVSYTTAVDPGNSYIALCKLRDTDPASGSAWTTSDLDSIQVAVTLEATPAAYRVTGMYAMVWCTGQINTTVTPGAASLTLTAYSPSAKVNNIATPGALSLTTTRYTPSAILNNIATPGALSAALTAYAPAATVGLAVTPGTLATALTAYTPTLLVSQSATPGTLALATTRYTPTALLNSIATPGALSAALTAYAPAVTVGLAVTPGALATALTAYTPTVINPQSATPGAGAMALTAYGPSVLTPVVVTPATLSAVLTAHAPSAPVGTKVTPGAGAMALTAYGLAVNIGWQLTPGPASLAVMTYGLSWTLSGFPNPDRRLYGAGRFAAGGYGSGRFGSINRGTGRSDQPGRGAGR